MDLVYVCVPEITWFLSASRKSLGFSEIIEIELGSSWVVEIDLISVLGMELDWFHCRGEIVSAVVWVVEIDFISV